MGALCGRAVPAVAKPLAACRVALVTTAAPYQAGQGRSGTGRALQRGGQILPGLFRRQRDRDHDLRISHVAIDRKHTTAEDPGSYFPLHALRRARRRGRIGSLAPRFHGVPTNRSHRTTLEVDCPEIVARCKADGVDAAILVPNCPVCHQSVSLAARALEESGIATVVMGCAKDIVEYVGVPRFLFSDFPLGNAAGRPKDAASQAFTLDLALRMLETAPARARPSSRRWSWSAKPDWKLDYCNIERLSAEEIKRRRAEFDRQKELARNLRVDQHENTRAKTEAPGALFQTNRSTICAWARAEAED